MPHSTQPVLRVIQEALEANGLQQTRDTVGVDQLEAREGVSLPARQHPIWPAFIVRGTVYTPGTQPF